MRLDEPRMRRVLAELGTWGVVEEAEGGVVLTRRFRAALARAAAQLQADEARGAEAIRRAAALALVTWSRPEGAALGPEHAAVVAGIEIASLPDAVRAALGA